MYIAVNFSKEVIGMALRTEGVQELNLHRQKVIDRKGASVFELLDTTNQGSTLPSYRLVEMHNADYLNQGRPYDSNLGIRELRRKKEKGELEEK